MEDPEIDHDVKKKGRLKCNPYTWKNFILRLVFRLMKPTVFCIIFFAICVIIFQTYRETIGHFTRPIWDKQPAPLYLIPNYGWPADGDGCDSSVKSIISVNDSCAHYGFTATTNNKRRLFDGFLFNNELDLLEIRLHQLHKIVDYFIIVECNLTFTNIPKPFHYEENKARFEKFHSQIIHVKVDGSRLQYHRSAFAKENFLRHQIFSLGMSQQGHIERGDLALVADIDEIPRVESLKVLKYCDDWPSPMLLQMKRYLYSFEFQLGTTDVTTVTRYAPGASRITSHHRNGPGTALADSGWHCSFCFKYLEDFVNKMESYSHSDRAHEEHKDLTAIQYKICNGMDLYDRYPMEAYNWYDVVLSSVPIKSQFSVVGLPAYVINNHKKFDYLLPGHCVRENKRLE